ncbi:helix-turn-helix domain-containing protein [Paenibacillus thiaminolyticus]|uniref:helix-turn-helix domain-containing protein n=1 Tax=Paenibacillus thiaminolyticus TaxID=49283 RepID=UPI00232DD44A|nr:helix-turn-helix domain-containing protein [Paenibacillus thiaminolyticus]WCF08546.1 helix-turn-helix domain-containing protein [Paenibacillus thiaminolyticus]
MRWNHFKSKLLFKYILSYLSIFLVPLIVMTFIIYQNAVNNLRSEIEQSSISQLEQAKRNIDGRMKELEEIAARISFDSKLTPYMVRHDYYGGEAIDTLDKYKANSSIVNEMFLYFHGDDVIYSSRGMMSVDTMFDFVYDFSSWNKNTFVRDLNAVKVPTMRPTEQVTVNRHGQNRMLAYLVPIPTNQGYKHGTVTYLIEESMLTGMMESVLSNFQGNAYIFDQDGRVLAAASHGGEMEEEAVRRLAAVEAGIHTEQLGEVQQSVVAVKSDSNGWTYVTAMPSKQFFGRVVHIQIFILMIFAVTILFGSILAILLAKRQYHPIRDLLEFANLKRGSDEAAEDGSNGKSELEWIRETLVSYRNQVDLQEPYARNQYLLTLLKRGAPSREDAEEMLQQLGIVLSGRSMFVIILAWEYMVDRASSAPEREAFVQQFTEFGLARGRAMAYGVELSHTEQLALLVSMEAGAEADDESRMEAIVEDVHQLVEEHMTAIPTMGIGSLYTSPEQLNQSYIEAASALEYRIVNGKGSVTFFSNLTYEQDQNFWIAKDSLIKLTQSLKQGNATVAVDTIGAVFRKLQQQEPAIPLLRCMCFDVLNTVLKTASELGLTETAQQVPDLAKFETLEQLEAKLCELVVYICSQVEHQEESEQRSLTDEVVTYISEHYCEYDLSLEKLAEMYRVSVSYLSRSIKEKTGHTFSQHVWQLRMDEVIRHLKSGNEPLKDIIIRVGYMDVPNFIRKFKKETGHTPGQYRKLYGTGGHSSAIEEQR